MTEGIDIVFENVYNFLRLCHVLLQTSFNPPRKVGSETSKKWIGSDMSEKTYSCPFIVVLIISDEGGRKYYYY
jgi:hypothetical protein